MKTISGDLIQLAENGHFDVIAHGCNCFCTMGAGIAKAVKEIFPAAFEADKATQRGDRAKLGTCSFAESALGSSSLVVVNAYTQFDWRGRGPKVDYAAVRSCMGWIKQHYSGRRIGLPRIGAGLAGGDWPTIAAILEEELSGEDVILVEFKP
jgi:O-acetyl-ADP-ribose deacetylase (regulator of RNase III)